MSDKPVYHVLLRLSTHHEVLRIIETEPRLNDINLIVDFPAYEALKAENEALRKKIEDVAEVICCQSALDKLEIVDRITSALVPPKKGDSK